jgi:hypothetical protein
VDYDIIFIEGKNLLGLKGVSLKTNNQMEE